MDDWIWIDDSNVICLLCYMVMHIDNLNNPCETGHVSVEYLDD